jgi:hypothetical protein
VRSWYVEAVLVDIGRRYRDQEVPGGCEVAVYSFASLDAGVGRLHNNTESPDWDQSMCLWRHLICIRSGMEIEIAIEIMILCQTKHSIDHGLARAEPTENVVPRLMPGM